MSEKVGGRERQQSVERDGKIGRGIAGQGGLDGRGVRRRIELIPHLSADAVERGGADEGEVLDARREDVGVDVAEIDHVLCRIECGHQVAAVTEGEIGQNVRALTAEQNLFAETADKIRFSGARRSPVRRYIAVSQDRCRHRPARASPPEVPETTFVVGGHPHRPRGLGLNQSDLCSRRSMFPDTVAIFSCAGEILAVTERIQSNC